jgi:hypothetical protein
MRCEWRYELECLLPGSDFIAAALPTEKLLSLPETILVSDRLTVVCWILVYYFGSHASYSSSAYSILKTAQGQCSSASLTNQTVNKTLSKLPRLGCVYWPHQAIRTINGHSAAVLECQILGPFNLRKSSHNDCTLFHGYRTYI